MFMIIGTISDKTAMINRRHFIELRYHRRYQKPYCEEGQATQWPKEKGLKNKQRSTIYYTEN
jgi:hypothetical protein